VSQRNWTPEINMT